MTDKQRKVKEIKAWAGICDGKLNTGWIENAGYKDSLYGIFRNKKEARSKYELVVPVTITYTLPPKKI